MKKWIWAVLALGLSLGLVRLWSAAVSPGELEDWLARWGGWAPAAYILAFTVLPVFFFPVAVLALAGGMLFGLFRGTAYTLLGAFFNCALMFLLARRLGRRRAEDFVRRRLSPAWQARLARAGGREGVLLLIVLRLIPAVPYNLINYAFGLSAMPLGVYSLASLAGIVPGTVVFINIGDKMLGGDTPAFVLAVGLLGLLLAGTALLGRRLFPPRQAERDPAAPPEDENKTE